MNILIIGANAYIGQRLIRVLLQGTRQLYCCVRNKQRFEAEHQNPSIYVVEVDFLDPGEASLPVDIDVAFYLIHSLAARAGVFEDEEERCVNSFNNLIRKTNVGQIIYLGGKVLHCLTGVMLREDTYGHDYDIGGPEVLSYKQMLLQFA